MSQNRNNESNENDNSTKSASSKSVYGTSFLSQAKVEEMLEKRANYLKKGSNNNKRKNKKVISIKRDDEGNLIADVTALSKDNTDQQ